MVYGLIRRTLDVNWLTRLELNFYSGKAGKFVCRGRIQISLGSNIIIESGDETFYIVIPLLRISTPRNNTTIVIIFDF